MDWQLPDTSKNHNEYFISLPSILSTHLVSIWGFRQYSDRLESVVSVNFRIWSQYVG